VATDRWSIRLTREFAPPGWSSRRIKSGRYWSPRRPRGAAIVSTAHFTSSGTSSQTLIARGSGCDGSARDPKPQRSDPPRNGALISNTHAAGRFWPGCRPGAWATAGTSAPRPGRCTPRAQLAQRRRLRLILFRGAPGWLTKADVLSGMEVRSLFEKAGMARGASRRPVRSGWHRLSRPRHPPCVLPWSRDGALEWETSATRPAACTRQGWRRGAGGCGPAHWGSLLGGA